MKKGRMYILGLSLILAFSLNSCSDGVVSDDPNNNQSNLKPTFTSIQKNVFDVYCISCHSGSSPNGGLNLEEGKAYNNLVNKQNMVKNAVYVSPNNSESSFLILKLNGSTGVMPPTGKLSQNIIDSVKVWIDAGALNN